MFWIIFLFSILYTRLPKFAHFVPRKKIEKKSIKYYNWWIKKMNIVQPKGIEDFGWCVTYSLFQLSTLSLISLFIYLLLLFFYVSVVGNLCSLENWYYRILILMTGFLQNATLAVDALSIWYVVLFSPHVFIFFIFFLW